MLRMHKKARWLSDPLISHNIFISMWYTPIWIYLMLQTLKQGLQKKYHSQVNFLPFMKQTKIGRSPIGGTMGERGGGMGKEVGWVFLSTDVELKSSVEWLKPTSSWHRKSSETPTCTQTYVSETCFHKESKYVTTGHTLGPSCIKSYLFRNLFLYSSHSKYLLNNLSITLIRVLLQNVSNTSYVRRRQIH